MNIESMLEFLIKLGIHANLVQPDRHGFSRTIEFTVYDTIYRIVWFTNESTLRIGGSDRSASIPFRHIYLDTTYPLSKGNKSMGFSYTKNKKKNIADREYPYEVFRIPLELPGG